MVFEGQLTGFAHLICKKKKFLVLMEYSFYIKKNSRTIQDGIVYLISLLCKYRKNLSSKLKEREEIDMNPKYFIY